MTQNIGKIVNKSEDHRVPGWSRTEHCTDDIRAGEAPAITLPSCHYTEHSLSLVHITKFTGTESE